VEREETGDDGCNKPCFKRFDVFIGAAVVLLRNAVYFESTLTESRETFLELVSG